MPNKFNLKTYQKISGDEHIDSRLEEDRGNIPNEINEKQLETHRGTEPEVLIEKQLDDARQEKEATELPEKRLDTKKGDFEIKYRNPSAYEGDINKLEEKRLASDPVENEKYTDASETPKDFRWWEAKSPDGLKVARKRIETAEVATEEVKELEFGQPESWGRVVELEEPPDEDEDEAFLWYGKSADQGLDKAQYKVGIAYLKGSGVDEDAEVAKVWLQKAADQGYPPAQYQLGKLLASKRNKDYSNALVWLQKAQDNGYEPATREIRKVKRKLN